MTQVMTSHVFGMAQLVSGMVHSMASAVNLVVPLMPGVVPLVSLTISIMMSLPSGDVHCTVSFVHKS
jgi:hypothetical protein